MGSHAVRRLNFVFVLTLLAAGSALGQECAVGGSVWAAGPGAPVADVAVAVAQDRSISDTTRREDGVYVLLVPRSIKNADIVFRHPNYLGITYRIRNELTQNKTPVVYLTPTNVQSIRRLSDSQVEQLAEETKRLARRGIAEGLTLLWEAALDNREKLRAVAKELRGEAERVFGGKDFAGGEALLKRVILIQSSVLGPTHVDLADTFDTYGSLHFWRDGRPASQAMWYRAEAIRSVNRRAWDEKVELARTQGLALTAGQQATNPPEIGLPNLGGITVLAHDGAQYGQVEVPAKGRAELKVFAKAGETLEVKVFDVNKSTRDLELELLDEKGASVASAPENILLYIPPSTGRYTVRVTNRGDASPELTISIRAWDFPGDAQP